MFNLFRKQKINPIVISFISLNDDKKESVISLLLHLAGSDQHLTQGIKPQEFAFIDHHIELFKLKEKFTILNSLGIEGVLGYLKDLHEVQKEHLILLSWKLLSSDEEPNRCEILEMHRIFNKIGISSNQITLTLEKSLS